MSEKFNVVSYENNDLQPILKKGKYNTTFGYIKNDKEMKEFNDFEKYFESWRKYFNSNKDGFEKLEVYYYYLRDYSIELLDLVRDDLIKTRKFTNLPTIAEINEVIKKKYIINENSYFEEIKELIKKVIKIRGIYRPIKFSEDFINYAISIKGGYEKICMLSDEQFEYWFYNEFKEKVKEYIKAEIKPFYDYNKCNEMVKCNYNNLEIILKKLG